MAPMHSPDADGDDPDAGLLDRHGATLLSVASDSVAYGIEKKRPLPIAMADYAAELRAVRATFVTLTKAGELRGCVGTCQAEQPLVEDVAGNAFAAAYQDSRFPPLAKDELDAIDISISLLSRPRRVVAKSEDDLRSQLRPGVDGLIIGEGARHAVFLPDVWRVLASPRDFLENLKQKAGFAKDHWSARMRVQRFTTRSISRSAQPVAAEQA